QTGFFIYDVWDPAAGLNAGHTTLANNTGTDIFCSSALVLPQGGNVFIAGGDKWTGTGTTNTGNNNSNLFNYTSNSLTRQNNMNRARWYSSSIVLLNGEVYTQGGSGGTDFPEIRGTNGTFRLLSSAATNSFDFMYPRNFIAPDGRVFGYDSNGKMYYINPAGNGAVTTAGQFTGPTGSDASAAMFRPGRILQFGGNSNGAVVIDIRGGSPVVQPTGSMSSQRRLGNATILADGKVLATGGSPVWNDMTNASYTAEIWDPNTGVWTVGASANRARMYHSGGVLMPDGSVLVAGGGAPGPQNNTNFEVFYPQYLYDEFGLIAARPTIESAPSVIDIGQTFGVDYANTANVSRVVMIKTAAVTHSFNMEQRFIELTYTGDDGKLRVQAPTRATDAPPGFYMLFVFDTNGTPSIARIVKVNVATLANPAITPVITHPGNQEGLVGASVALQLSATDPNGDSLSFDSTALPAGVTLDPNTGLISGTPTTPGIYNVVVSVTDGVNTDISSFVWTITLAGAMTIGPMPSPTPRLVGQPVPFGVSVTGGTNVRYSWQFDDGSEATGYSSDSSAAHVFTRPGIYYVTVTAIDDNGLPQSNTVVQTVHLPLTANRPTVSSNIVIEDRAANDRLWVINQDNDSVSVFDAVTNAKLKEITVGSAPRTIAIAPNGEIWVTNKQTATISVISPSTLAVTRTLSLPFASQPFGIAMAPVGGHAYIALEATGKLLKVNAATYAIVSSVDVGTNPRHVSINSAGTEAYVTRFITPAQPGESTAAVETFSGGIPTGGQVVVVNATSLAIQRTIVLRHSDKADAENQGRGVPNYLGASTVSPDGQSAWVPSKQDNIQRGVQRDGRGLDFQNTVRAIGSKIDIVGGVESYESRVDFDNSGVASAAAFDPTGVYMFVALETSREVAIVSAHDSWQIFRINVGRAPQGLALSADGRTLYVNNFMDRTVNVFDLTSLLKDGTTSIPLRTTLASVTTEKLTATVLRGKQFFYDAKDTRLARDAYISCASCHNDGGHDGRVWDITGFGEGLRNTITLRGRAGMAQGFLHWSNNFNEVQDFEGQIRNLSGGTGLMTNAQFNTGTRSQPLGDAKTGVSADLDALAAYVASLNTFASSPQRNTDGTLTAAATAGRTIFAARNCASCHGGTAFSNSGSNNLQNVGTLKSTSGKRLNTTLTGIDIPTLRDVWTTAPYLHDGSAATVAAAIRAHNNVDVTDAELPNLVAYVSQIGNQETSAPVP
ncbi:MAG TPA: galactose oxidase-like domain-containing protein, partial [Steroidobacteraceae bacterium]|nr:galactose oxidase-like domain-containing protein [Steroidobacteraceae bacterium]